MRTINRLSLFFLLLIAPSIVLAGQTKGQHTIDWQPVYEQKFSDESVFRSLNFSGASFNEEFLPEYVITEALPAGTNSITATLSDIQTAPLSEKNAIRFPNNVSGDFVVTAKVIYRKKQPYSYITVLPIRKISTDNFEKLLSFSVSIQTSQLAQSRRMARVYAPSSVLASGDWYKVGVTQNGVYRLSYSALKNLGLPIDSLDPRQLQLFGNGGGMLPFLNSTPRVDDLKENSILVEGENDAHFDSTDYILFYGTAQTRWSYDSLTRQFNHDPNYYSDTTYFFLTYGQQNGKRVADRISETNTNTTVTTFNEYAYHEADMYNLLMSGREWLGEQIDNLNNSITINFNTPNARGSDTIFVRSSLAGRATSSGTHSFSMTINGTNGGSQSFATVGTSPQDNIVSMIGISKNYFSSAQSIATSFYFNSTDPSAQGWINWVELNYRRDLNIAAASSQMIFRDLSSVGIGKVSNFIITGTNTNFRVWDVTDPTNVENQELTYANNTSNFGVATDIFREFIAFEGQNFLSPTLVGRIENQNLHGLPQANMLIVTHPNFLAQAQSLADFHRTKDNLTVNVVTTREIFNEFSSGSQDVSAIRDFAKMFYDRAGSATDLPKYLLLFGDASYDNKYRIPSNTNYVTSYQSAGSINNTQTYISDDFFGLLDDSEGNWNNGETVDLSIGRLPVKNSTEANSAINKITTYSTLQANYGSWRNMISFVADDQDYNIHFRQTDTLAERVRKNYLSFNVDKIYLDAYQQLSTPGGQRFPDGHQAILDRVQNGTLLITYIGHGGELGWGHERFLENNDINSWTNFNKLAGFLTATCEFTRVDDPNRTSAGEYVFLNPNGGSICMFTTSRLAFSSSNNNLCLRFYNHLFEKQNGKYLTTGEIFEKTKVDMAGDSYVRNFILIGDPALRLAYPEFVVKTNSINGNPLAP
ncbi:MAG: type IX secretion system sortase PorU [Bacteroidetes bacterium]|nr:type IX secretion system sortase PorU [Bacteroidota bacterium]